MSTIIKNGTPVTLQGSYKADIKIDNGIITEISTDIPCEAEDVIIDANNQQIFPGGIDLHTHFDHVGVPDDFAAGSKAAIAGGITTVSCFVEGNKELGLLDNFRDWKYRRSATSYVDYTLVPVLSGKYLSEFETEAPLLSEEGVGAVKLFMAYRGAGLLTTDVNLYRTFKNAKKYNLLCNVHCENGDVIDEIVDEWVAAGHKSVINHAYTRTPGLEAEAVYRAMSIANAAGAPVRIVHVSCEDSLDLIASAQKKELPVLAETCPHYLVKDISYLDLPEFEGAKNICAPPLREKKHLAALWKGINDGVITTVSSDHAPVNFNGEYSKQLGRDVWNKIPNGCPGVEEIFSIIYHFGIVEKRISLEKFVEITSVNPAKEFGLYPKKGCIAIGSDADLVILNPSKSRIITHDKQYGKTDYSGYEGFNVTGVITHVISRGEEVVKDGIVLGKEGRGQFIRCNKSHIFAK